MIVYLSHPSLDHIAAYGLRSYDDWSEGHNYWWKAACRWVYHLCGEPICWQRMPTIRTVPANEVGYPLHREAEFGHSVHTINLWAPMTKTDPGALHIGGHQTRPMRPGECVVFEGHTFHGSPQPCPHDRVSIDARFLPLRWYAPTEERSRVAGVRLDLSEYYGDPRELA